MNVILHPKTPWLLIGMYTSRAWKECENFIKSLFLPHTPVTSTHFTSTFHISSAIRSSATKPCIVLLLNVRTAGTLIRWPCPIFCAPVTLTHFTMAFDISSTIRTTTTESCIVLLLDVLARQITWPSDLDLYLALQWLLHILRWWFLGGVYFTVQWLKFFRLGQFLSNYWSYRLRVIFGTCVKCLCLGQFLSNYCSNSQWYLVHAYISTWPLECSHPYLILASIWQSIRHATLSYLLI